MTFHVGQKFEMEYPFVKDGVAPFDDFHDWNPWRPGTINEERGGAPDDPNIVAIAHGVGKKICTVVEFVRLHRPFPSRVFFTVSWVDPDGKAFGKNKLHCTTRECFLRRATQFAYPYEIAANPKRELEVVE